MDTNELAVLRDLLTTEPQYAEMAEAQNWAGLANALNAATTQEIDNPEPQGMTLPALNLDDIIDLLEPSELNLLLDPEANKFADLRNILDASDSQELRNLTKWLGRQRRLTGGHSIGEVTGFLVDASERALLGDLVTVLVQAGKLSQATAGALSALMTTPILDPDWQPTITQMTTPASEAGLPAVRVQDVWRAMQ